MDVDDVLTILHSFTFNESHTLNIPSGLKNDVYFVVKNDSNVEMRRSSFPDVCGVWNSSTGASPKSYFMKTESGNFKMVTCRNEKFFNRKKVKDKMTVELIEPQPKLSDIVILQRYYTTLKIDSSYKKRISWLKSNTSENIAVIEYLSNFPGLVPHGNSKRKK